MSILASARGSSAESGVRPGSVPVRWDAREPPLVACGLAAVGPVADRLLWALEERLTDRRVVVIGKGIPVSGAPAGAVAASGLSGVFGRTRFGKVVVLTGDFGALPWVDGVTYLGRDLLAPGVLLPTLRMPLVPIEVYASAVRLRVATEGLIACVEDGALLVPMLAARPLGIDEVRAALAVRA